MQTHPKKQSKPKKDYMNFNTKGLKNYKKKCLSADDIKWLDRQDGLTKHVGL